MLFSAEGNELLEIETTKDHVKWLWGGDRYDHLYMCQQLREHDEQNGMSKERTMQHLAAMDEHMETILLNTRPEVFKDSNELKKWLKTDVGKLHRVSRDARPIRGDGLQVIIR